MANLSRRSNLVRGAKPPGAEAPQSTWSLVPRLGPIGPSPRPSAGPSAVRCDSRSAGRTGRPRRAQGADAGRRVRSSHERRLRSSDFARPKPLDRWSSSDLGPSRVRKTCSAARFRASTGLRRARAALALGERTAERAMRGSKVLPGSLERARARAAQAPGSFERAPPGALQTNFSCEARRAGLRTSRSSLRGCSTRRLRKSSDLQACPRSAPGEGEALWGLDLQARA
jgi:hypothetical protein